MCDCACICLGKSKDVHHNSTLVCKKHAPLWYTESLQVTLERFPLPASQPAAHYSWKKLNGSNSEKAILLSQFPSDP